MSLNNTAQHENEMADVHSASSEYASRFSGETGSWMLAVQEQITKELVVLPTGSTILDVGGGHGQLAIPLANAGYKVTVLGSEAAALNEVSKKGKIENLDLIVGSLKKLNFNDKSFDCVICFRLLCHYPDWIGLLSELCRVTKNLVIFDYPTKFSLNAITPLLFKYKKELEGNTRSYALFQDFEINSALKSLGFKIIARRPQFFWPMVLHRSFKNPTLSKMIEMPTRLLGMTKLFGSPVILSAIKN